MRETLRGLGGALLAVAGAAPTWTAAGVLALLGLAGSVTAVVVAWLSPVLIGLSLLLLGRSFYLLYVRKRGTRAAFVITWLSTVFVIGFWTWRLI